MKNQAFVDRSDANFNQGRLLGASAPRPATSFYGMDLSVNDAAVDFFPAGYAVLRTGAAAAGPGGFTGGGSGNKAIMGVSGLHGTSISNLREIRFTWKNVVGPAGPFYNPPSPSICAPYMNLIVDFAPKTGGNIRVLPIMSAAAAGAIATATGTYDNPGGLNTLTYSWDRSLAVQIVNSPPLPAPGGVAPIISALIWQGTAYKWQDIVDANGEATLVDALLVDAFPDDGGLPAGAIVTALILNSSDSSTRVKQGKQILSLSVNGVSVF